MFTDQVKIQLKAGKGGNGVVAWRREKYIPKGGPCGGNGGKGGSVVIEADVQVPSLDAYRNKRILRADAGGQGGGNNRKGRDGSNLVLKVPPGTLVKDRKSGEILFDLTENQQKIEICRGGRGGLGNTRFKTPTNRAPTKCTPGWQGEEQDIELELKLIADVGFVGFPNAGKSTLLTQLANVNIKTAPYPFTTLKPNLGYYIEDYKRILFADIPGIIDGAHQNRGLGHEFLRHIERTSLLLFVIDATGEDPAHDLEILFQEIKAYNPDLLNKPRMVVLNKADLIQKAPIEADLEISALTGQGVSELIGFLKRMLNK
ncbi:MAG: GTPase Obg [Chlamydiales bacterium]|nr:GTPase Obg [Chlamydiales bacterium]MCH9619294.1 GTPase Obg [Chlamydiales bacterium]MCH9622556.1 GTPase Obg [Chlamydiales bacterium]